MFGKDEKKSFDVDSVSIENGEIQSFTRDQVLLATTHGKIYCVGKKDGNRYWRQDFPTGAFGGIVSIFVTDDDTVIVGGCGKTACLDLFTGASKWVNKMKGFGYEEVGVMATPSKFLKPKAQQSLISQNDFDPSAPPAYGEEVAEKQVIFGCSRGKLLAIDAGTGEELWRYNCPNGGYNMPSVLVEPKSQNTVWPFQVVYVGCGRWVYCLKAETGEELWVLRISNSKMGLGFMGLATPWSSRLIAESHTSFTSIPHAQVNEVTED